MIPRTGESYERVVEQLKKQYQNPRRVTMSMINKLKSMRQCREDSRSLRNNLNDVQAIIETLRKQGEIVDTTHMLSMVLDTFCKRVQEEVIKKEFDSNKEWNMSELLENLSTVRKTFRCAFAAIRSEDELDNISAWDLKEKCASRETEIVQVLPFAEQKDSNSSTDMERDEKI
ncbi:hypothetical protein ANCCEY_12098 [Ancylostoma ceylanicum]|uniref:Uncharacterized protein n=1 Tax=Ancylostoma ceylanicum TaxID=53326 RepID=A0A0D6LAI2_9BILA|nr:hypothetical protein ANCCEY_12098 [Ancylostoma ceylanicum]